MRLGVTAKVGHINADHDGDHNGDGGDQGRAVRCRAPRPPKGIFMMFMITLLMLPFSGK